MPKRSELRDTAKAEYCERRKVGPVNLREFAESIGASHDLVRRWKSQDHWEDAIERKRGGQPGNKNSKGKKNAKGHTGGAPVGNKNAEKDGAYSAIFFDRLTDEERLLVENTPTESAAALRHEMQILKLREKKILDKIALYENAPDDELYISSLLDMRTPGGKGKEKKDGANQTMGMYTKETPFARIMKLQEALHKTQGRIATIANSLRAAEETEQRLLLEKERLEIMRMRATGAVEIPGPDDNESEDYDADEL